MAAKKKSKKEYDSTPAPLFPESPAPTITGTYTIVEPAFTIKQEGIWYLVKEEFVVHKLNFKMKFGCSFRECTDGTYIAHDENNMPLFFRLNNESIKPCLPYLELQ